MPESPETPTTRTSSCRLASVCQECASPWCEQGSTNPARSGQDSVTNNTPNMFGHFGPDSAQTSVKCANLLCSEGRPIPPTRPGGFPVDLPTISPVWLQTHCSQNVRLCWRRRCLWNWRAGCDGMGFGNQPTANGRLMCGLLLLLLLLQLLPLLQDARGSLEVQA